MVINVHNGENGGEKSRGGCGSGGTCSTGSCGSGLEKVYPTAAVRYGYMKSVGEFHYPSSEMKFGCGAQVVIQTDRGIEIGEMVSLTCDGCDKCVSRDQIRDYVKSSGPDYYHFGKGKILRLAAPEDLTDWEHIRAETLRKKAFCQERADELNLPMKVLECEHLFGGERLIFFFMAEGRVDFRALVKQLADEFQTRIEMRQVGARDEARLLADYETCGRECCCKNFLKTLKPVSMKMAKMQKATLDPAKVSGRCGRLKCCLRYEHTTYEELNRKLPPVGTKVFSEDGNGIVVARQILTQLLHVETEGGGRVTVPVESLLSPEEVERREAARLAAEEARKSAQAAARRPEQGAPRREGRSGSQPDSERGSSKSRGRRSRRGGRRRPGGASGNEGGGPASGASGNSRDTASDGGTGAGGDSRPDGGENAAGGASEGDGGKKRRRRGRRPPRRRGRGPKGGDNSPSSES